jgi:SAM-dependent methyltransferase
MGSEPIFEEFAEEFERHAAVGSYNAHYDRPAVLDLLGDVRGKRVLDAGCGPGLYADELLARGAEIIGFDQSPEMVRLARRRLGSRADLRVHDLADPLDWIDDESFDVAVLALVIHHVDDRVSALRELHRALRAGGHLVVSTHHPTTDWLRLGGSYFLQESVEEIWNDAWQVRFWRQPLATTCDEFFDAGFLIERIVEPTPSPTMADVDPDDYQKLSREPGFIAFRLLKPPRALPQGGKEPPPEGDGSLGSLP